MTREGPSGRTGEARPMKVFYNLERYNSSKRLEKLMVPQYSASGSERDRFGEKKKKKKKPIGMGETLL